MSDVNKDNVRLWIHALESGNYKQAQGALVNLPMLSDGTLDSRFCCLGVACEVARENGVEITRDPAAYHYGWRDDLGGHVEGGVLPLPVRRWLGFDFPNPSLNSPLRDEPLSASALNDSFNATFADIAAALRMTYGIKD